MKKLEATWVIAWGLLLGFGTGAVTLGVLGHIAWSWVGLAALAGWLISYVIALWVNSRAKRRSVD